MSLLGGSCGHVIKSNYIGTDATGTTALGNYMGVSINSCPNNQIGVGGKNVISGNEFGFFISQSSGNIVQGNYIGTDATGTQFIPNMLMGVHAQHESNLTIGPGNVITGGLAAVGLDTTTSTSVLGNFFCTDKTGTTPLGDLHTPVAVNIRNSSSSTIGDVGPGLGNVIACRYYRVFVDSGIDNSISGNSIYSINPAHVGIDLAPRGITPNDVRDNDSGPNDLQNYPVLNDAINNGSETLIFGSLSSSFNTEFVIDFYSSPACSWWGAGDGKTYLGSINVATAGRQHVVDFEASLPVTVPVGHVITATATTMGSINNTSEFSNCAQVH